MINTVWQGFFSRFHVAFVIKRLLYIEFRVFKKKRKGVRDAGKAQKGYCPLAGVGCDRGFLCRYRAFWFYVVTWFYVSRHGSQTIGVAGSRQGFSLLRLSCFSPLFLSRQRSLQCRNSFYFMS